MVFGQFGAEKKKQEKKWQQRRRNVVRPGQQRKPTSVPTSRRLNVATSARFLPQNHKKQWKLNFEVSKNVRTGARKVEQQRLISLEKTLSFCISSFFINC